MEDKNRGRSIWKSLGEPEPTLAKATNVMKFFSCFALLGIVGLVTWFVNEKVTWGESSLYLYEVVAMLMFGAISLQAWMKLREQHFKGVLWGVSAMLFAVVATIVKIVWSLQTANEKIFGIIGTPTVIGNVISVGIVILAIRMIYWLLLISSDEFKR